MDTVTGNKDSGGHRRYKGGGYTGGNRDTGTRKCRQHSDSPHLLEDPDLHAVHVDRPAPAPASAPALAPTPAASHPPSRASVRGTCSTADLGRRLAAVPTRHWRHPLDGRATLGLFLAEKGHRVFLPGSGALLAFEDGPRLYGVCTAAACARRWAWCAYCLRLMYGVGLRPVLAHSSGLRPVLCGTPLASGPRCVQSLYGRSAMLVSKRTKNRFLGSNPC